MHAQHHNEIGARSQVFFIKWMRPFAYTCNHEIMRRLLHCLPLTKTIYSMCAMKRAGKRLG